MKKILIFFIIVGLLLISCPVFAGYDMEKTDSDYGTGSSIGANDTLTLMAWVKWEDASVEQVYYIFQERSGENGFYFGIYGNGSWGASYNQHLNFATGGGSLGGVVSQTQIPVGAWTHIAATYDNTTQRIYVNGVLDNSRADNDELDNANTSFYFGCYAGPASFFDGIIADVRIYNRVLSREEICTIMNGFGGDSIVEGLVRHYKGEEQPIGTALAEGSGRIIDYSGNAGHLTVKNSPVIAAGPVRGIGKGGN